MKNPKEIIKDESKEIFSILDRIKRRDFRGNTGIAIKNSLYQFGTNMVSKGGSFIFVIIIARLLLPEMFGLYSLALSTVLLFGIFSELGIGTTLTRFLSKEFGKKKGKFRKYLFYLARIQLCLIGLSAFILLISARYVANVFYQKPIFLALIAGIFYIAFNSINGFLKATVKAANRFDFTFKREVVFQMSRIILVPLAILFAIKYSLSSEINLMLIIIFLSLSIFFSSLILFFGARKIYLPYLEKEKISKISKKEKSITNKFLLATAVFVLSGTFFGNIDKIMLGKFVEGSFIGFYTAAFSLAGAVIALIGIGPIVLLPIFSRLKGKRLERGFNKSLRLTLFLAFAAFLAIIIFANLGILIVYGSEYMPAINILKIFSILLFVIPVIAIYQSYYFSRGKANTVAFALIISTILNIILNYYLITSFLKIGQINAVYGAAFATIISKFFLLGYLVFSRHKNI